MNSGAEILKAMEAMRSFFGSVARLLRTAEGFMNEAEWSVKRDKRAFGDTSTSIDNPQAWLPTYFLRVYSHDSYPELKSIVAIFLENQYQWKNFKEPIIVVGCLAIKGGEDGLTWYRMAQELGTIFDRTRRSDNNASVQTWKSDTPVPLRAAFKGKPLVSITNTEQVKAELVEPLLDFVTNNESYFGSP